MVTIRELADRVRATGPPNHKIYEPSTVSNLPVINNSNRYSSNVNTSIDCYVSGQYTTRKGKTIEVTQRYTLYISYNKETQAQTIKEAQDRISSDFQNKYGAQFNIVNIFVPQLPIPIDKVVPGVGPGKAEDMQFYAGSRLFKAMSAYEKQRSDIGLQRRIADKNIQSIRNRYKIKR